MGLQRESGEREGRIGTALENVDRGRENRLGVSSRGKRRGKVRMRRPGGTCGTGWGGGRGGTLLIPTRNSSKVV